MFAGTFLVDTNSYVRIAKSTQVILGDHGQLELRLIPEIAKECDRSSRLKNVASWITQPPHPQTRQSWTLQLDAQSQKLIKDTKYDLKEALDDCLEDFAEKRKARGDFRNVLSLADQAIFFTAYALGVGIVTDEGPLTHACKEFDVPHYTSLQLLKHLNETQVITDVLVSSIVKFWQYEEDLPSNWKRQYLDLFGPPLPVL